MAEMNPNSLANLKKGNRFKKGRSGNPAGRSKTWKELEKLAQSHAPEAIDTILDLMRNSEIDRVRLAAAEAMLNRGLGKPRMRLDESVQHDASQSFIEALREINARPRIKVVDGEVVEVPNKG